MGWQLETTDEYERDLKELKKKWPHEFIAVMNNFNTYWGTLIRLDKPESFRQCITGSYIHPEEARSIAVDQSGANKILGKKMKLKETRLYFYPSVETRTVYLLKIGDKDSQTEDNNFCRDFVRKLRGN